MMEYIKKDEWIGGTAGECEIRLATETAGEIGLRKFFPALFCSVSRPCLDATY